MAQLVPDQFYNDFTCSQCKKYLSVLPIKVYSDGSIKCGRCCEDGDGGTISLCNKLFKKCLFKCINRYEGCRALMSPEDVVRHEEACPTSAYECPNCTRKLTRSAFGIVQHFRLQHTDCVLQSKVFHIKFLGDRLKMRYMYVENELVFLIFLDIIEDVMYLCATVLTDVRNVFHKCILRQDVDMETEMKQCVPLQYFICDFFEIPMQMSGPIEFECELVTDLSQAPIYTSYLIEPHSSISSEKKDEEVQPMPIEEMPKLELTKDFMESYPGFKITPCGTALFKKDKQRIELTCVNCKEFIGNSVYICKKKHMFCWDCKAWCGICGSSSIHWNGELSSINELLLIPCRWKCGRNFTGIDLREHQVNCDKFMEKCPKCLTQILNRELKNHMRVYHANLKIFDSLFLTGYLKDVVQSSGDVFFLQNFCLLHMRYVKSESHVQIIVDVLDGPFKKCKFVAVNRNGVCSDGRISLDDFPHIHLLMPVKKWEDEYVIRPNLYYS